jgi:hypothetical protein
MKMDVDIGNLLYIIITLVVLSLGLFGKKKKKQVQGGAGDAGTDTQPGFLENLEKMLSGLGQEEQVRSEPLYFEQEHGYAQEDKSVRELEPGTEEEEIPYHSLYEEMMERQSLINEQPSGESPAPEQEGIMATQPLEVIELEEEKGTDYFKLIRHFDAGAAILYSAIIDPIDY